MRVIEAICGAPWAIQEEALHLILQVAQRDPAPDLKAVAAQLGRPLDNARTVTERDGVAVIPVSGPLFRYANLFSMISGATSVEVLATDLRAALDDPKIGAILLEIDSPGGEANGVAEMAGMIREANAAKPVAAYVSGMGASAAYWLAVAAGEVVISSTAALGSIGVASVYRDRKDARDVEFISSQSPNKRPNPATEKGKAQIQALVDATAEVFVADVASYRGVTPEKVLSDFGAGGLLIGKAAVEAGMADRIGTFEGLVSDLSKRADTTARKGGYMAGNDKDAKPESPGWLDGFRAWMSGGSDSPKPDSAPPVSTTPVADTAAADARFSALEAQLAEERGKRFAAEAAAFADRVIPSRAMPAERATIVALHTQAAADDARDPQQVTFGVSADKQPLAGSRVQAFEAAYLSRPESLMTRDSVPAVMPDGSVVLSTSQGGSEDELKQVREQAAAWARANGLAGNGAKK